MKKKLIFVTKALWIGGIETALVNLLTRLDAEKFDVTCLILQDVQTMAPRLPEKCRLLVADREHTVSFSEPYRFARLFHLAETPTNPSWLHRALMGLTPAIRWVENRLYIRYLRRQLRGEQFDTAIIYSDVAAETAVRAVRAEKYLMFYHHGAMRAVYHDEIGYCRSRKIIAVSRHQAEALRQFRPKYAEKVMDIHNLTDIDGIREKAEAPISETFPPERFHIVSCGRMAREKGMDLAVEACAALVAAGHTHVHWWLIGGGPEEAAVREKVHALGMEDHVTMLGMRDNPYPYICRADLYVQPSRVEGYPLSILEALILGRVVVSTANPGAKEILCQGETGVLCGISAEDIAGRVGELLREPEKLNTLRRNVAHLDVDAGNVEALTRLEEVF